MKMYKKLLVGVALASGSALALADGQDFGSAAAEKISGLVTTVGAVGIAIIAVGGTIFAIRVVRRLIG